MATEEPLPLVPPTITICCLLKSGCSLSLTCLTRSSPSSIVVGCNCSSHCNHWSRVLYCLLLSIVKESDVPVTVATQRGTRLDKIGLATVAHGTQRVVQWHEFVDQGAYALFQVMTMDDHVD